MWEGNTFAWFENSKEGGMADVDDELGRRRSDKTAEVVVRGEVVLDR